MTETKDFQKLFYSLYPSLCVIANKYIANQVVCEDIVQECFIKYWEISESGKQIQNPVFYLNTSIKNSCISYLRKKKFEDDINEPQIQALLSSNSEGDTTESKTIDEKKIVKKALDLLPDKCREIFELSKIQNKSYKEIAEILNISIKTVENQMGKALKTMRQFVKDNPEYFPLLLMFLYNYLQN